MTSNPNFSNQDLILGFMLWASIEDISGNPLIPDFSVPTYVYAILWNRVEEVERIIQDVETGYQSWRASYEINNRSEDEILVDNKFIPYSEASEELLSKIGPESTGSINDKKVLLVLGGRNGLIDYYGAGLVLHPADPLNPEIQLLKKETASASIKKIVCQGFKKVETASAESNENNNEQNNNETASQENQNNGGSDMDKEKLEQLKNELKQEMASLSPTLQSVIDSSGIDAGKAKQIVDAIKVDRESKASEIASVMEKKFSEGYVTIAEKDEAIKGAVKDSLDKELPKAKESWEQELASIKEREKAIETASIPLTDTRKEKIKSFSFDEEGNKAFQAYVEELKEIASSAKADTKTKKETASQGKETASIGGILNSNQAVEEEKFDLKAAF